MLDNFLQPRALQRLRDFLLRSSVWTAVKPDGYLGAYLPDGFSTPLLYQAHPCPHSSSAFVCACL